MIICKVSFIQTRVNLWFPIWLGGEVIEQQGQAVCFAMHLSYMYELAEHAFCTL